MSFLLTDQEKKTGIKLLDGRPYYLALEILGNSKELVQIEPLIERLENSLGVDEVQYLSITLDSSFIKGTQFLKNRLYKLKSQSIEFKRDLQMTDMEYDYSSITFRRAEEVGIATFLRMWDAVTSDSLNTTSFHSVEEQYAGMKQEIGEQYRDSCYCVYRAGTELGIVIPIIEPGTVKEGRLFYLGLLPTQRGKGLGTIVHRLGLYLLKQKGATYYVGSTGIENKPMQQIFQNNDCVLDRTVSTYSKKL